LIFDLLPDQGAQHREDPLYATRTTYFTMEAGQGTLEQFLRENNNKIMDWRSGLMIVVQILWGVQHISSLGFAHMDLKLDNIIWLPNKCPEGDQFVIGDLGTACFSPVYLPQGHAITGNQGNRAPEVIRHTNRQVNVIFNDIWAVGCILFEIFQNRHPFIFGDAGLLESRICDLNLPRLDQKWGLGCSTLLELMWNRNGEERISPEMAVRLCSMLLWGFPLVDLASVHTSDQRVFSQTQNTLSRVNLDECQRWLKIKKEECYQRFSRVDRMEIETFLQVQFLSNTTADDLLRCVRLFETKNKYEQFHIAP
jgi:serine/threonine protein kinase